MDCVHPGRPILEAAFGGSMTYLALLRGINVGGNTKVAMADLRECLAELGFDDVRSLLQSGNVVFSSAAGSTAELERALEAGAPKHLGMRTDFFVRTVEEWQNVVARNPFRREAQQDPSHLLVTFLKAAPDAKDVKALQAAITGREVVRAADRHLYIVFPDGIGRSRLTGALIEKKLGTRATGRNWNTVLKMAAAAGA